MTDTVQQTSVFSNSVIYCIVIGHIKIDMICKKFWRYKWGCGSKNRQTMERKKGKEVQVSYVGHVCVKRKKRKEVQASHIGHVYKKRNYCVRQFPTNSL